ncbi:MAG: dihydrodipicolinate reductase [Myxococcota bacterium]
MTFKVVQWATGNVGRASLRGILAHPELELVGCLVHSPEKAGRDAGELCRRPQTGVVATTDVDEVLALDADCVAHMPLPSARYGEDPDADLKDLCRILRSGRNVVTTVGYVYPRAYGEEVEARLREACAEGGTSLHGTGTNPGWMNELLPLTMSALSERIDRIHVRESTNFAWYPSREIIFEMMGMGSRPEAFEAASARYTGWLSDLFRESLFLLADGLAAEIEDVLFESEVQLAKADVEIAAGRVAAGTVDAQRFRWQARVGGEPRLELEAVYKAHADAAPDWPEAGFLCRVEGRPGMTFELSEGWMDNALVATAFHAVHAIPAVCRAEPGIRTFLDLPLLAGRHVLGKR